MTKPIMPTTEPMSFPSLNLLPEISNQHLNGKHGQNREKLRICQIRARNDHEALQCWLNEYRHKQTTFRTYQKEAERFLLWSIYQRQKPLSALDRDDLDAYLDFLDDPKPREKWCGAKTGRGCRRGDPDWRPFIGALSYSAKMTAISAIDSLFNYLVDACYLTMNPMLLIRKKRFSVKYKISSELILHERILTIDEWHTMLDTLDNYPESIPSEKNEKERLKFLIAILYLLGLRVNELATHCWNAFRNVDNQWWFYVMGKGDKLARIPVNDELLRAMIQYRASLKKSPYPALDETKPLIASFTTGTAITPRQINKLLKKLALETGKKFVNEPEKSKKLKKFSAHWLRHLSASMQDKAGISFKHIRANHRHENDATTRRYVHAIDKERHHEMQRLTLRISNNLLFNSRRQSSL
jgi:integrase